MHIVIAAVIIGIAATWGVPLLAKVLKMVVPANYASYLPSSTVPDVNTQSVVTALIYGVFVFAALWIMGEFSGRLKVRT